MRSSTHRARAATDIRAFAQLCVDCAPIIEQGAQAWQGTHETTQQHTIRSVCRSSIGLRGFRTRESAIF